MKKIFTILFVLFVGVTFAQPTLLSTELATPGNTFYYKHIQNLNVIDTSLQGANQTWNFTALTNTSDSDYTITIVNPAQTPNAAEFPTSNFAYYETPLM